METDPQTCLLASGPQGGRPHGDGCDVMKEAGKEARTSRGPRAPRVLAQADPGAVLPGLTFGCGGRAAFFEAGERKGLPVSSSGTCSPASGTRHGAARLSCSSPHAVISVLSSPHGVITFGALLKQSTTAEAQAEAGTPRHSSPFRTNKTHTVRQVFQPEVSFQDQNRLQAEKEGLLLFPSFLPTANQTARGCQWDRGTAPSTGSWGMTLHSLAQGKAS